ncbi:MAG: peptide-methionine (S)-S-oxide reductase MsrA [Thiotrichaceae bacterium]
MNRITKNLTWLSLGLSCLLVSVPAAAKTDSIVLGMGCFWGAEKYMAKIPGVTNVESGYAGGDFKNATYKGILNHERKVKSGRTQVRNHAEVVKVSFDDEKVGLRKILATFWETHNPTQGNRQGNDVGTTYRSAIFYNNEAQNKIALETRGIYQEALDKANLAKITTEIAPLKNYAAAEEYHQDYLVKNPKGYCALKGTKVAYPGSTRVFKVAAAPLNADGLNFNRQLIVFEGEDCQFCEKFKKDILNKWQAETDITATLSPKPPKSWKLKKTLFATPTIVLFEKGVEVSRYTGYNGEKPRFWKWLGFQLLTPAQQKIAFKNGTERAFTGSNLDETRPGKFVDPITGETLFFTNKKFKSGTGWPSFFDPVKGSITLHKDTKMGMTRTEVRSASSGIHLGHVFNDGPAPTYKRYCINGNVLKFVPDTK